MSGRDRASAFEAGLEVPTRLESDLDAGAERAVRLGGIVARAIRSHQLWLTVGYFAALLLLARAYA